MTMNLPRCVRTLLAVVPVALSSTAAAASGLRTPAGALAATVVATPVATPIASADPSLWARGAWTVKRDWDRSEIARFARWVTRIWERKVRGAPRQRRARISEIFQDGEMNLFLHGGFSVDGNDPRAIDRRAFAALDAASACGTVPILLFIYYCAVRGLPATFTRVGGSGPDIRYSVGNHPVYRLDPLAFGDLASYVRAVFFGESNYTTGNWRTAPDLEGTDTVPVSVSPESTIPGLTVLYNSDGHGLLVARVTITGTVNLLDGHPDGSITAGQTLAAVEPVLASVPEKSRNRWYAGWRMIRLARCLRNQRGAITGIRPCTNEEMRPHGYSDEQYTDILAIRRGQPVNIRGKSVHVSSFPEYVRSKLQTTEGLDLRALVHDWAEQLHTLFQERAIFVAEAWENVLREGPIALPDTKNIYQAEGRWELWSSPSSDCDRKSAYFLGVDQLDSLVREHAAGRSGLLSTPSGRPVRSTAELVREILEEKRRAFEGRAITYTTSRGRQVTLGLAEIETRLFTMSFDPNHAPEIRWGAAPASPEASGFRRIGTPLASGGCLSTEESYRREEWLRYRLCRKSGRTSFDDPDNPRAPLKSLLEARLAPYRAPAAAAAAPAAPAVRAGATP
jgi:hypothetical protein